MSKIYITGDINEEAYLKFSKEFRKRVMSKGAKDRPIYIEINSGGGSAIDALAIAGKIRHFVNKDYNIITVGCGCIYSAAVVILAAGGTRCMFKEAWVMVHEDSDKIKGKVSSLEKQAKHLRRLEDQWSKVMEELTNTSAEQWSRLHKEETYLDAEECLGLGLVDELL